MQTDIAVVGCGLAGLQAARLLASRGLRVVLLDRKTSVAEGIQTTGIFVRKTWEDFAFLGEQLGAPLRDVVLYSPARRALKMCAEHDEYRVGRMPWILIHMLEGATHAGAYYMPETRLVDATFAAEETILHVERGRKRTRERIRARMVIGADGPKSLVARLLGLDRNREFLAGVEDVLPSLDATPALHCYLDPKLAPGYIAWVANDGEESHVGLAGYPRRFNAVDALATFRASLGITAKPMERRGGLIPVGGILRRIGNRRGLLVGDAAGAVSPLTAGGLDAALRLSAFAADVAADFLERRDVRVLGEYSGDRFQSRFITRKWMRKAMSLASSHALPLELACAMLRETPLRRVAEHVFFSRGSFPDVRLDATHRIAVTA